MSSDSKLMQPELFGQDENVCPGYDVCPIGMCGCRFLGLGTPFASDVNPKMVRAAGFRSCGHAAPEMVATTRGCGYTLSIPFPEPSGFFIPRPP